MNESRRQRLFRALNRENDTPEARNLRDGKLGEA